MRYLFFLSVLFVSSVYSQYEYEHVPLSELRELDAEVYFDDNLALFIKYDDHWYEVLNTDHHTLCPCYQNVKYHKDLCRELSEY